MWLCVDRTFANLRENEATSHSLTPFYLQSVIATLEEEKERLAEEVRWLRSRQDGLETELRAEMTSAAEEHDSERQRQQEEVVRLRSELTELRGRMADGLTLSSASTPSADRNSTLMIQRWESQLQVRTATDFADNGN